MASQNTIISRNPEQNRILDLEKEYFTKIEKILTRSDLIRDLIKIESYIQASYENLSSNWNQRNKLEVPAEKLISYYIFKCFPNIEGIYESTICSDIAFLTEDAIINIDVKTTDFCSNTDEISLVQIENNQSSFTSKNIFPCNSFSGYDWIGNLPTIDEVHSLPVLSYTIKINYQDDKKSFKLYRKKNNPTITLSCIPNGKLENLFNFKIVDGFKTYTYNQDDSCNLPLYSFEDAPKDFFTNEDVFYKHTESIIAIPQDWERITIETKFGYYDPVTKHTWLGKKRKKPSPHYLLSYTEKGKTARLEVNTLSMRFDSKNVSWSGHKEYELLDESLIEIPQ